MNADELRSLQAPLKDQYREDPQAAQITLTASGTLGEGISCNVETSKALVAAGLHPATGGDGLFACSGDMLLESLVACAGVTLQAVATAIGVNISAGSLSAEGDSGLPRDLRGRPGWRRLDLRISGSVSSSRLMLMRSSLSPCSSSPSAIVWSTRRFRVTLRCPLLSR